MPSIYRSLPLLPRRRPTTGAVRILAGTAVLALAATPLAPTAAGAATSALAPVAAPAAPAAAQKVTRTATFTCLGFPQTFLVPRDVTTIGIDAIGAPGGFPFNQSEQTSPGRGAEVAYDRLTVRPLEQLTVQVGCQGETVLPATGDGHRAGNAARPRDGGYGYGRGGLGGPSADPNGLLGDVFYGGGGGGATAVSDAAGPLVVAGGGGGPGGSINPRLVFSSAGLGYGGPGGDATPLAGGDGAQGHSSPTGPGGVGGRGGGAATPDGLTGTPPSTQTDSGSGGGGGAGFRGGRGGAGGAESSGGGGGGGGSSYSRSALPPRVSSVVDLTTPPSLTLTWTSADSDVTPQVVHCSGAPVTYTVPPDVLSLDVTAIGAQGGATLLRVAQGGDTRPEFYPAGWGGGVTGTVAVTPGQVLTLAAGCVGDYDRFDNMDALGFYGQGPSVPGGFGLGSGGFGGQGSSSGIDRGHSGSGGGGSSGVRAGTALPLIEAGGGGGDGGQGEDQGPTAAQDAPGKGNDGGGVNPGHGGAAGAPGSDTGGGNAATATGAGGGGGGGGSVGAPGGGGSAGGVLVGGAAGRGSGGSGGGAASYVRPAGGGAPTYGANTFDLTDYENSGVLDGVLTVAPSRLIAPVDLAVQVRFNNHAPQLGGPDIVSVTVTNNGPSGATDALVTNALPPGLRLDSSQVPTGTTFDGATGAWRLPTLAAGESSVLRLTGTVTAYGQQTDSARVTTSAVDRDAEADNDYDYDVFAAYRNAADVAARLSADDYSATTNQVVTFTLGVENLGPQTGQGLLAKDTFPAGLTPLSIGTPTQGTASLSGQTVTWSLGQLTDAPQNRQTLTVQARYTGTTKLTDNLTVTSTSPEDPFPANNTATVGITPNDDPADLAVSVADTVTSGTASRSGQTGYLVTVTDNGPNAATAAVLDITLSTNEENLTSVTYYDPAAPGTRYDADVVNDYPSSTVLHWRPPVLIPGQSYVLDLRFPLQPSPDAAPGDNPDYPRGTITATRVASSPRDPVAANDTDSGGYNLERTTDLSVFTNDDRHPTLGDTATLTVRAVNYGPYDATGVTLAAPLPQGLALVSYAVTTGAFDPATQVWTLGDLAVNAAGGIGPQVPTLTLVVRPADLQYRQVLYTISGASPRDFEPGNDQGLGRVQAVAATPPVPPTLAEVPLATLLPATGLGVGLLLIRRRRRRRGVAAAAPW